jgi:hypothetical protein
VLKETSRSPRNISEAPPKRENKKPKGVFFNKPIPPIINTIDRDISATGKADSKAI